MMVMAEVPTELFVDVTPSAATSAAGEVLDRIVDLPVGAWTPVLLAEIDPTRLTAFELPAYLTAWSRVQAWAAARVAGGVVELASRAGVAGVDKEVAVALSEPVGAAQQRLWRDRRLHRMLPETWQRFRYGELSANPWPAGTTVSEQLLPTDRTWHRAKTRGERRSVFGIASTTTRRRNPAKMVKPIPKSLLRRCRYRLRTRGAVTRRECRRGTAANSCVTHGPDSRCLLRVQGPIRSMLD